jgi:hypothetical protein
MAPPKQAMKFAWEERVADADAGRVSHSVGLLS